jgi:predicted amidophosphoribosyltransferase
MPLAVVCFCGYFCNYRMAWRSEDYDSYKWVQALKGRKLNKYALVLVRGVKRRLSTENLPEAAKWFGTYVSDYLNSTGRNGPFLVVPVPDSRCVADSTTRPRTRKLAKAICDALKDGSVVLDCLRWKKNLGSASEDGGPREVGILYRNLVVIGDIAKEADKDLGVLLVDDVMTSGGHLRACAAKLKSTKLNVEIVMCGGKTVYDQANPAFHIYEDNLDEYEP